MKISRKTLIAAILFVAFSVLLSGCLLRKYPQIEWLDKAATLEDGTSWFCDNLNMSIYLSSNRLEGTMYTDGGEIPIVINNVGGRIAFGSPDVDDGFYGEDGVWTTPISTIFYGDPRFGSNTEKLVVKVSDVDDAYSSIKALEGKTVSFLKNDTTATSATQETSSNDDSSNTKVTASNSSAPEDCDYIDFSYDDYLWDVKTYEEGTKNIGPVTGSDVDVKKIEQLWLEDLSEINGVEHEPLNGLPTIVRYDSKVNCWVFQGTLPAGSDGFVPIALVKANGDVITIGFY